MKFVYFPGCKIPYHLPQYDTATRSVLNRLEIKLIDCELNCCGYPVRHQSFEASVYSAARILSMSAQYEAPILTPCKCCYGNLKQAIFWLSEEQSLREHINRLLSEEGLVWHDQTEVKHLLSVLWQDVGVSRLRDCIIYPFYEVNVAVHHGCHGLRPSNVFDLDNPLAPNRFENLVALTGALPVDWSLKLECCGAPLWGKNDAMALKLMSKKLISAKYARAHILCTACTYCQNQFDKVQAEAFKENSKESLPAVLYPQLLGLAMGIDRLELGMGKNSIMWLLDE